MSYYERSAIQHLDGTAIFQTPADKRNESEVASLIGGAWGCELHQFGALSPIDWYAVRDGRMIGLLELKSRAHESDRYPTVFLNVRKWLALNIGAIGLGVPAIFVAKFLDGTKWIPLSEVDAE